MPKNNNADDDEDVPPPPAGAPRLEKNNSAAAKAVGKRPVKIAEEASGGVVRFEALLDLEYDEVVVPKLERHRVGEVVVHAALIGGFWIWGLASSGVGLFSQNAYGYDKSACHCVVVNHYFGLWWFFLSLAVASALPQILLHNPDCGAFGPKDDSSRVHKMRTWSLAFKHPHKLLLSSIFVQPAAALLNAMVVPLFAIVVYYMSYGFTFVFIWLSMCRIGCKDWNILNSGNWGGRWFVGHYRTFFSKFAWPPTPVAAGDWGTTISGREPGVVGTVRLHLIFILSHLAVGILSDILLYCAILYQRRIMLQRRVARGISKPTERA